MKHIFTVSIFLVGMLRAAAPPSWDKIITVRVHAPDHKFNGKPWDMNPMVILPTILSPMFDVGNPNPDMMLCIVDRDGESDCIYDKEKRNVFGVPFSICQDSLICEFTNVKVPSSGYFGMLVVDLDWLPLTDKGQFAKISGHDYMIGAEVRNNGQKKDPVERFKIEEVLRGLIQKWGVIDAPKAFPEKDIAECTMNDPCFGSDTRGIPSIGISAQEIEVCGLTISGSLSLSAGSDKNAVGLTFASEENKCSGLGTMEYLWQFGDGATGNTTEPTVEHSYPKAGKFDATMTPRCVRKESVCDAPPILSHVTVAP